MFNRSKDVSITLGDEPYFINYASLSMMGVTHTSWLILAFFSNFSKILKVKADSYGFLDFVNLSWNSSDSNSDWPIYSRLRGVQQIA